MKRFHTTFEGHDIEVTDRYMGNSELYVDQKLQEVVFGFNVAKLNGEIKTENGVKNVRAYVTPTGLLTFQVKCDILVDNNSIFSSVQ